MYSRRQAKFIRFSRLRPAIRKKDICASRFVAPCDYAAAGASAVISCQIGVEWASRRYGENYLSPAMPAMSRHRLITRPAVTASPSKLMPTSAAPTALQTA